MKNKLLKTNQPGFLIFIFLLVGATTSGFATTSSAATSKIGGIKSNTAHAEQKPCASSCAHDATQVAAYNSAGECVHAFTYPCSPYTCDKEGKTCASECSTNHDCSVGALCDTNTGTCIIPSYSCSDPFTVSQAGGKVASCAPYRCLFGHCREQCVGNSDCSDGYTCDSSHCVKK